MYPIHDRLGARVAYTLAAVLLVLGAVQAAILGASTATSYEAIERQISAEDLARLEAAFAAELQALADLAREFGAWDDTRAFVEGRSPEYPESTFSPVWLSQIALDSILICDLDARVAWAWHARPGSTLKEGAVLASLPTGVEPVPISAYDLSRGEPVAVAAWPITSNDFLAPPVGWFVLTRSFGEDMLGRIESRTGLRSEGVFARDPLPEGERLGEDGATASYRDELGRRYLSAAVSNRRGEAIGYSSWSRPRRLDPVLGRTIMGITIMTLVSSLASALILILVLRGLVVRPLELISAHLERSQREGRVGRRLGLGGAAGRLDELGAAADHIDAMLEASERRRDELELANAELKRLAATDPLTGLANRRSFNEHVGKELRRLARLHRQRSQAFSSAVLLCDIDYFKAFNDLYGHQAGDACLKAIALAIAGEVHRPGDLACRYGGEEFLILLPGTNLEGALVVAERVRLAVKQLGIPHGGSAAAEAVTMSIGVAVSRFADDGPGMERTISAADKALYEAKQNGRDRVAAAPEGSSVLEPED